MHRQKISTVPGLALLALAVALAAGCGGGGKKASSTTTASTGTTTNIQAPANIKSAGKLVFCSDITYPPEEFYKAGTTTPQGSDIDIGNEVAKRMGVTARFDNTGFEGIIAALLSKKCDAIISGMNDTPERRKQVAFVDYLKVGQSFLIAKSNPKHITDIKSLSGKVASVEVGTTNKDYLDALEKHDAAAFRRYQAERRPVRDKLNQAGERSIAWYENVAEKMQLAPYEFAHDYMLRTGVMTAQRLAKESPGFVKRYTEATGVARV